MFNALLPLLPRKGGSVVFQMLLLLDFFVLLQMISIISQDDYS